MKQDITSTIEHTVEVRQIYKGIADQIDEWISKNLIVKPEIGPFNIPIKDIEFTPTNYDHMYICIYVYIENTKAKLLNT